MFLRTPVIVDHLFADDIRVCVFGQSISGLHRFLSIFDDYADEHERFKLRWCIFVPQKV